MRETGKTGKTDKTDNETDRQIDRQRGSQTTQGQPDRQCTSQRRTYKRGTYEVHSAMQGLCADWDERHWVASLRWLRRFSPRLTPSKAALVE
jgi:hypothetical protein